MRTESWWEGKIPRGSRSDQGKACVLCLYPQEDKSLAGATAFGPNLECGTHILCIYPNLEVSFFSHLWNVAIAFTACCRHCRWLTFSERSFILETASILTVQPTCSLKWRKISKGLTSRDESLEMSPEFPILKPMPAPSLYVLHLIPRHSLSSPVCPSLPRVCQPMYTPTPSSLSRVNDFQTPWLVHVTK